MVFFPGWSCIFIMFNIACGLLIIKSRKETVNLPQSLALAMANIMTLIFVVFLLSSVMLARYAASVLCTMAAYFLINGLVLTKLAFLGKITFAINLKKCKTAMELAKIPVRAAQRRQPKSTKEPSPVIDKYQQTLEKKSFQKIGIVYFDFHSLFVSVVIFTGTNNNQENRHWLGSI